MVIRLMLAAMVMSASLVGAAQQPAPAGRASAGRSFDVASVKPNKSGAIAQSSQVVKGSLTMTNMRMRAMLGYAYGIRPDRIVGLPSWTEQDRFDISARAPAATPDAQLRPMLRTLLTDRFRLVFRTEMRDQPVYALALARNSTLGPNLKPSTECDRDWISSGAGASSGTKGDRAALPAGKRPCAVVSGRDGRGAYVTGGARPIGALVDALRRLESQGLIDRAVIDRTGLTGTYDFDLRFAPAPFGAERAADLDMPSVFTAIQEQLGLRLEPARGLVEFFVVERLERPTPD